MKNLVKLILLTVTITTSLVSFASANQTASSSPNSTNTAQTANSGDQPNSPSLPVIVPAAPNINAEAYVLMDVQSGKIIAEKNMHQRRPPASLTKLMTLYVASAAIANGQISLTDKVRVSKEAWQTGGSRMFLKLGSHVPVQDLIDGIIIASGNDACVALADYIGGNQSSFVNLMNQTAQRLGMKDTHYTDPTGLPHPDHYSTAYDIALLARAIIQDFPQDYQWYKQKWITWNNIRQPNRNRLLWRDPYVDGMKTGHTKEAGYCLVASGEQNSQRFVSVVMGAPTDSDRMNDSQALLNYGFRFFETHKLYAGQATLANPRVWMGENKNITAGVDKDLYVTIPKGTYDKLQATVELDKKLRAPIEKGQTIGTIKVTMNNNEIAEAPLIALENDPVGGLWDRLRDHVSLIFSHWFSKA